MTAQRLLDEGKLSEALGQLEKEALARPGDLAVRTFLFELLGFAGELDRAERQLDAIERLDLRPEARTGIQAYRVVLDAERARARLFELGERPRFFFAPPPLVELHLEAVALCRGGLTAQARDQLERASALDAPSDPIAARFDVDRVRDTDHLLGPVLEVFTTEGYYWVPWDDIHYLVLSPPKALRDLLWAPAKLATNDGVLGEVYLPNLYPDSHRHPDEAVRLGRATYWNDAGDGIVRGAGAKMFVAGGEPRTLHEICEIEHAPEEPG